MRELIEELKCAMEEFDPRDYPIPQTPKYAHLSNEERWELVKKECRCGWAVDPSGDFEDSAVLTFTNPDCPIHGKRR